MRWFTEAGDQAAAARTLNGMCQLLMQEGEYAQALERGTQALELRRAIGDPDQIAHSEQTIGSVYARLGRYRDMAAQLRRAAVPPLPRVG